MGTFHHIQQESNLPSEAGLNLQPSRLKLRTQGVKLVFETAGTQSGQANMSRDELLLEEIRHQPEPTLLVRTYCWEEATLSLGKHQSAKDREKLHSYLGLPQTIPFVTRPTGGRAILHGSDIAFAFITNAPVFLNLPLKDCYCVFTYWLKKTLNQLGYETISDCTIGNREYLRSALCFETKTPSDILAPDGRKLAGCAQARRAGGILQHGSAFLNVPVDSLYPAFSERLFQNVETSFH